MKRGLWPALFTGILLILFAGCGGPAAQPLVFNPAPWSAGEVSTYDLKDRNGAPIGTASWTWQEDPGTRPMDPGIRAGHQRANRPR